MDFVTGRQMTHAFMRAAYEVEDVVYMVRAVHAERVVFHDGDAVIAPGIEVHRIGGHTRGLQAVRIATERGNVVLASDTSHYFENFEQGRVFSIVDSAAAVLEGYRRLRELAARPELIVPGHDPLVMRPIRPPTIGSRASPFGSTSTRSRGLPDVAAHPIQRQVEAAAGEAHHLVDLGVADHERRRDDHAVARPRA